MHAWIINPTILNVMWRAALFDLEFVWVGFRNRDGILAYVRKSWNQNLVPILDRRLRLAAEGLCGGRAHEMQRCESYRCARGGGRLWYTTVVMVVMVKGW